jgi:hypothetical protein
MHLLPRLCPKVRLSLLLVVAAGVGNLEPNDPQPSGKPL